MTGVAREMISIARCAKENDLYFRVISVVDQDVAREIIGVADQGVEREMIGVTRCTEGND